ncbi:acyl-protein synthetase LuxE [Anseongella ginsenosidimutans]|uniref:Acyl-protein synthetase LuxE n=1 Tax=Anseongella ginsenosidimutans TaxID=496056 RepID=A0A4R3KX61_9SPHI|nr:acyl transferase [Anseongella ginsenosidimutans]QEC50958.1 acyl transferase [Anseongella ginsenosidimutans]TCS90399.1 acyl-protein synthetase LuxE [Anseongella ginsenosidimutans]
MITASGIFGISSAREFREKALDIFRYQARANPVYREFTGLLGIDPEKTNSLEAIPFLPIGFFKTHRVITEKHREEMIFTSSGTTGAAASRHLVAKLEVYRESFRKGFEYFYGNIPHYRILALLPGYLERSGSSLVLMADELIKLSGHPESGFFLHDHDHLLKTLLDLEEKQLPALLIGVSHALLDFAEKHRLQLKHTIIMETGGMKGRRKELVREELHGILKERLGVSAIHSEYGMTELLSQAYSRGKGRFACPPWMQISIRELNDPFTMVSQGRTGAINIIDLANIYSCSFIATDDLGKIHPDGSFEVLGRFDNSDIRGCNLLIN